MLRFFKTLGSITSSMISLILLVGLLAVSYTAWSLYDAAKGMKVPDPYTLGQTVEFFLKALPKPPTERRVAVLPIKGDSVDQIVRRQLEKIMTAAPGYKVIETSDEPNTTRRQLSESKKVDAVIQGGVVPDEENPRQQRLVWSVEGVKESSANEAPWARGQSPGSWIPEDAVMEQRGPLPAGWGLLAWVGCLLLLPIVAASALVKVLEKESNAATFLILLGLTLVNVLLALWFMGWEVHGLLDSLMVLTGGVMGGFYNFLVLERLESLRA